MSRNFAKLNFTKMDSMPMAAALVEKWSANQMINWVVTEMGSVNTSQIVTNWFLMFAMRLKTMAMVTRVYDVDRMSSDDEGQSMMWPNVVKLNPIQDYWAYNCWVKIRVCLLDSSDLMVVPLNWYYLVLCYCCHIHANTVDPWWSKLYSGQSHR